MNKDFALQGTVACECGNSLTAAWSKSCTGKRPAYYVCQNRKCDYKGKSIRRDELEVAFENLLATVQPTESLIEIASDFFCKLWDHRAQTQASWLKLIEKEIASNKGKMEKLLDRIVETREQHCREPFRAAR